MTAILVTAADEGYASLLLDLLRSVSAAELPAGYAVGVLDLGLGDTTRTIVESLGATIVKPEWPFPPHPVFGAQPRYLSRAVRPFLRRYFPGHEAYVWLDADCWIQERSAIEQLVRCAQQVGAAVVPAVDRGYVHTPEARQWVEARYRMALTPAEAEQMKTFSYVNAGVVALAHGAAHWAGWERRFAEALPRWAGDFLSDQAVINAVIYLDRPPTMMMPAEYNWICHLRLPVWSTRAKKFVNPNFPFTPIGIMHNTFNDKQVVVPIAAGEGTPIKMQMTYSAYRALADRAA